MSKGRSENTSYSKVYEERRNFTQKDKMKNYCVSPRSTENVKNVKIRDDQRYQQFFKSDDSTTGEFSPICRSMAAEREIHSILNNEKSYDKKCDDQKLDTQKMFTKKFDKYSDRPLIEVSAPSPKASNIPRSIAKLAQRNFCRKINKTKVEFELKEIKVDTKKSNNTIIRTGKIKDSTEYKKHKNSGEVKIENQSKEIKLEEDLNPNFFLDNGTQVNEHFTTRGNPKNHLEVKFWDESNDFREIKKLSEQEFHYDEDQNIQCHVKHLAKGDFSSFQMNEDYSTFSEVESLYPQNSCGLDDDSLGFNNCFFDEGNYPEKANLEAIKQEISLNNLKAVSSAENILESELKENEIRTYMSASEENLIHEWITLLKKSKGILKESTSIKRTQSVGIQTVCCSSFDIIQQIRGQITEAIDR